MTCYREIWPIMATFDTVYPILINFRQVRKKRLHMTYVASQWHILHNNGIYWSRITCFRQWWPAIVKNIKFELVRPLQVRIEGPRSILSGLECTALWDMIGRIWSGVAFNGPVFVRVSRYDRLGPYLSLHYFLEQFWEFLSCLVIFRSKRHLSAKVARNIP